MVTGSKSGIKKKKVFLTTPHSLSFPTHEYYECVEPTSYTKASEHKVWHRGIAEEFTALQRQGTWSLVPYSPSKHIVGCRWAYKTKHSPDGSITIYKARLVAKGFHQEYGVDYTEISVLL